MQTTAQLRAAAYAAEEARDYALAAALYQAALAAYPHTHAGSKIAAHDRGELLARLQDMRAAARAAARENPRVCVESPAKLKGASLRFDAGASAEPRAPRASTARKAKRTAAKAPAPAPRTQRKKKTRARRARLPLLAEIKRLGGIGKKDALALWGKAYVEGAPRGVFTRKGRGVDRMAIDLGAEKWLSAPLGGDQVGELAERIRSEIFGHASPHPIHGAPSVADMELAELVLAARSGSAEAQSELELRGVAWNPRRRRRNPDLLTIAGNPADASMVAARAAFRKFHGTEPTNARKIGRGKGVLVALGQLGEVVYKPRRGDRKGPAWFHQFGPGVVLAATPDGKHLFIIDTKGNRRAVDWARGIIR